MAEGSVSLVRGPVDVGEKGLRALGGCVDDLSGDNDWGDRHFQPT